MLPGVCARRLERPKLKMCKLRVGKGVLIKKVPTEKMGDLIPKSILRKLVQASFLWRKGNGRGKR